MLFVVETEAAYSSHVFRGERSEEEANVGGLVGDGVLAEDGAGDYLCLGGFGYIGRVAGEDSVAVVDAAVVGEEADETLWNGSVCLR